MRKAPLRGHWPETLQVRVLMVDENTLHLWDQALWGSWAPQRLANTVALQKTKNPGGSSHPQAKQGQGQVLWQ